MANIFRLAHPLTGVMEAQHLSSEAKESRQGCIHRNGLGEVQGYTNLLQAAPCPLSGLCGEPSRLHLFNSIPLCLTRCMKIKDKKNPLATSKMLLLVPAFDKAGQGIFYTDPVVAGKCPVNSVLTNSLRLFFSPFQKHPQSFAFGFRMNCSQIFTW